MMMMMMISDVLIKVLVRVSRDSHTYLTNVSRTYKLLTTSKPTYLHNLISLKTARNTRSSDVVTLARPSSASSLKSTDRSFQHASLHLWNKLPVSLREPSSRLHAYLYPSFSSPLSPLSVFRSFVKT